MYNSYINVKAQYYKHIKLKLTKTKDWHKNHDFEHSVSITSPVKNLSWIPEIY